MFSAPQDLIEKIIDSEDTLTIDIVGYYSVNNWNGRIIPQLIIKDIEVVTDNKVDEINEDNIIF
jgi:hypothetical protein